MAVVIRLKRVGANKKPRHRIVVADSRSPRDGRNIEEIGSYDPTKNPPIYRLDKGRLDYWLKVGAQPSHAVKNIINKIK
jgi:small subunit ribosomal protein S16